MQATINHSRLVKIVRHYLLKISEKEFNGLNWGLKISLLPKSIPVEEMIASIDSTLEDLPKYQEGLITLEAVKEKNSQMTQ